MGNDILKTKVGDFRQIVADASKRVGISVNAFIRMATLEKARAVLSNSSMELKVS